MSAPVCAVVGVGPGIGLAVARRFAREGFHLALVARRTAALHTYVAQYRDADGTAAAFTADAGDEASLTTAFTAIKEQLGPPQVLVYNALSSKSGAPSTLDAQALRADLAVNVIGALVSAKLAIPAMREQRRGTILFTGGGLALTPNSQFASLAVGKAALRSLCYSLGDEVAPDGIHVATVTIRGLIQPGTYFDPERIAEVFWQLHQQPLGQHEREVIYAQPQ